IHVSSVLRVRGRLEVLARRWVAEHQHGARSAAHLLDLGGAVGREDDAGHPESLWSGRGRAAKSVGCLSAGLPGKTRNHRAGTDPGLDPGRVGAEMRDAAVSDRADAQILAGGPEAGRPDLLCGNVCGSSQPRHGIVYPLRPAGRPGDRGGGMTVRLSLLTLLLALLVCNGRAIAKERYYSAADFGRVEKVDAHMHVYGPADRLVAEAIRDRVHFLTINVDSPDHGPIPRQLHDAASLRRRYPGRVAFAGTFSAAGFTKPGWSRAALGEIDDALAEGAVGVKIWKNFGMVVRDTNGRYVMPDDPRLEPIYSMLEREHIVLLGHLAEPLDCWLPYSKMIVKGDADYYRQHPQYYMYLHPDRPKHDQILAARDRMLAAHPQLRFDALHLASLEWDVDRIGAFLDRFPEADVDMA